MTVRIRPLFQARCDNRNAATAVKVNPTRWIEAALAQEQSWVTFHFFINWNSATPEVVGPLWIVRLIVSSSKDSLDTASHNEVYSAFINSDCAPFLKELGELANSISTSSACVLLGESNILHSNSPSWIVTSNDIATSPYSIKRLTLNALGKHIQEIRGGAANLGSKGLIYGTSAVECWLSKTNNIFPGDCDCLILNNGAPAALLEMKKHTLTAPISSNLASQYYPAPDGRKYDSLFALKRRIEERFNKELPLAVIYYATHFPGFRVQVIQQEVDRLKVIRDTGDLGCKDWTDVAIGERILQEVLR